MRLLTICFLTIVALAINETGARDASVVAESGLAASSPTGPKIDQKQPMAVEIKHTDSNSSYHNQKQQTGVLSENIQPTHHDVLDNESYLKKVASMFASPIQFSTRIGHSKHLTSQPPVPENDDERYKMLRATINKASELISEYKKNGLSNLPDLPHVMGLNQVMKVPDKLIRVELTLLQDLIQMAMEMMDNPVAAVLNFPGDVATMMSRVTVQIES